MDEWSANYVNNPDDDYNLVLEILHNDNDITLVYQSEGGLKLKYYASENDLVIPVNWLVNYYLMQQKGLVMLNIKQDLLIKVV